MLSRKGKQLNHWYVLSTANIIGINMNTRKSCMNIRVAYTHKSDATVFTKGLLEDENIGEVAAEVRMHIDVCA
jgi:hypothetical protein